MTSYKLNNSGSISDHQERFLPLQKRKFLFLFPILRQTIWGIVVKLTLCYNVFYGGLSVGKLLFCSHSLERSYETYA